MRHETHEHSKIEIAAALQVSRVTLNRLLRDFGHNAPERSAPLSDWQAWAKRHIVHDLPRRRASARHDRPAKQAAREATAPESIRYFGEDGDELGFEYDGFDAAALTKERVTKLRLGNQIAREELAIFRRDTITQAEIEETMAFIRAKLAEKLSEVSRRAGERLSGSSAPVIQESLDAMIRDALSEFAENTPKQAANLS
jgi:hypothetical protein